MKKIKVLVTGGCGYIGSHVVKILVKNGHEVIILDNLYSTDFIPSYGKFYKVDLSDKEKVEEILRLEKPELIMHFAAFIVVPESVKIPLEYYKNNVENTIKLLDLMHKYNIDKFIFSSSAAVYGIPKENPISEETPLSPINPYGRTKAMIEEILKDLSLAGVLRYVSLRYFNVAGADPEGELGPNYKQPTHLIIRALKTAKGEYPYLEIYGTDYPTPDGTCIRDYIHVMDLAKAHVLAMEYLLSGGESEVFNCGYGRGFSVKEVIEKVKRVTQKEIKVVEGKRRPGDPPVLVADNKKIKKILKWDPEFDDLELIITHTWKWILKS